MDLSKQLDKAVLEKKSEQGTKRLIKLQIDLAKDGMVLMPAITQAVSPAGIQILGYNIMVRPGTPEMCKKILNQLRHEARSNTPTNVQS